MLGKQGWELVTIYSFEGEEFFIFKHPMAMK
jgi:hypothetical protein